MDMTCEKSPEELPKLFTEIQKGFDVVYGVPDGQKHSVFRSLSSRFMKWLMGAALGSSTIARSGALRVFRSQVREALQEYRSPFVSIDSLLEWGTSRFGFVPVRHEPRQTGKSNYTFMKLVRHTFNMVTGSSIPLLRPASMLIPFTAFGF
jgi:undecaprenyl-phosphate 4-deoxy-4-formamido-L-arabinose transferase